MGKIHILIMILPLLLLGCGDEPAPNILPVEPLPAVQDYVNQANQLRAWQSTANATIKQQEAKISAIAGELNEYKGEVANLRDSNKRLAADAQDARNAYRALVNQPDYIEMTCPQLKERYDLAVSRIEGMEARIVDLVASRERIWAICDNVSGYATADNITEAIKEALIDGN